MKPLSGHIAINFETINARATGTKQQTLHMGPHQARQAERSGPSDANRIDIDFPYI
jgi:hypothetical protein